MKHLTSTELRRLYLEFFRQRGHAIIPSASLIPENDPTVLFTTAGMHPLVPYLMGQTHPSGKRLSDVQKCVRTGDIDEVGDNSHCTFFEMLGNWSLGDYFKRESIAYSWEFLTGSEWLGIDKDRLYFTVFAGDSDAPRDMTAYERWVEMGVDPSHIFFLGKKDNWWGPAGMTGPCGPDTEIFYDTGKEKCCEDCNPSCSCGKYLEIWNNVFMEYDKKADGSFAPLAQKNVDTGMGLDRTIATLQGVESVYDTDVFTDVIAKIAELSGKGYKDNDETKRAFRIIADHVRASAFILGDQRGVTPSNLGQGYILRRLIRRAIRYALQLGMPKDCLKDIAAVVIDHYGPVYSELISNREKVLTELSDEEKRFQLTIDNGMREFEKIKSRFSGVIDGANAFRLYDTYGFPLEFTEEMAKENGLTVDRDGFFAAEKEHKEKSRGDGGTFTGGLADHSVETARLHTATHLLQAALRHVLDDNTISQRGSNITAERLRFDFTFSRKVTPDELREVEKWVNEAIAANAPIVCDEMSVDEARASGAIGLFGEKYGDRVKVYTMGSFSKEICGGPHAENTGELGTFKIKKEEASSSGVRRIKAVLQ